jgi:hypothetical protein
MIPFLPFDLVSIVGVPKCALARDGETTTQSNQRAAVLSLLFAVLLSVTLLIPQDFCGGERLLADNYL